MLPNNFGNLADEKPELKEAILALQRWIERHPEWRSLDPRVLARELRDVDPALLSITLWELVDQGIYRRVYAVVTPSGVLAEREFDDPNKIPEKLPDRYENYFETADADIVPIFKPRGARSVG